MFQFLVNTENLLRLYVETLCGQLHSEVHSYQLKFDELKLEEILLVLRMCHLYVLTEQERKIFCWIYPESHVTGLGWRACRNSSVMHQRKKFPASQLNRSRE